MNKPSTKEYIGDSVYAETVNVGWTQLKLYTYNGVSEENIIYLEHETFVNIIE